MKEVTEAKVENKEKYRILDHCELLVELSFDSLGKVVDVKKCNDGQDVTKSSKDSNHTNH